MLCPLLCRHETSQYPETPAEFAIPVQRSEGHCRAPVSSHREATTTPQGSPAGASGATGTPVGWYMGRQWEIFIAMPIRPIRPRVVSNAITPRPTANLVRPPLFVVLGLPVVAPDHTAQISHGPLTFKDGMATPPISVRSVSMGGFLPAPAGQRSKRPAEGFTHTRGEVAPAISSVTTARYRAACRSRGETR